MAYFQRVWAQIDDEGIVRNRIVCDDYEQANYVTRCTYGEKALAVEINNWAVTENDIYRDNRFYAPDNETEREYIPDVEDRVAAVENKQASTDTTLASEINTNAVSFKAAWFMAISFTDEQAIEVPELYDKWADKDSLGEAIHYEVGDRRRYGDSNTLYKCITAHDSQEAWNPADAPSLWTKILIPDPSVIPEWEQPDSTNGYSIGDKVTHNGKTWESLVNNNVWEPGITGTEFLWKDTGSETVD